MKRMPAWVLALAACFCGASWAGISYQDVRDGYHASDAVVLDRAGRTVQRLRADFRERRGDWVALQDISPALQRAVILSEDRLFHDHAGVDWTAVWSAAWGNLVSGGRRGASTLSMQLLGFIDDQYRRGPGGRGIMQKLGQAYAALELEAEWSKSQILEAYLNLAAFRGELVGVDALARALFRKAPSGLETREAALAAVLLRGPNAPQAVLVRRACGLLAEMGSPEECSGLGDFVQLTLDHRPARWADGAGLAPHFARLALNGAGAAGPGARIATTLDADLQRHALAVIERNLLALGDANVSDAALVVLDNETGGVLAYVGSSGDLSGAAQVDHARALRQAGSTLKPFLYALAIEQERLTAVSLLDDGPLDLPTGNGLYIPQNYDKRFSGWVSVRGALGSSLNIPAVRALMMVTPEAFARRLAALGLPLDRSGDYYGYSLALGSADVSLLSLTNAYRALARGGVHSEPRYVVDGAGAAGSRRVAAEGAAWIVGDILADRQARARTFGFDSPLSTPFWTAVKTGTSKDMRDNWCVGWSSRYTVGVWVGNSTGVSMREVSGVSGAGPVWHEIMAYLHRHEASVQPPAPAAVRPAQVVFQDGLEPARKDYFLGDTAITQVRLARAQGAEGAAPLRIAAPADGTILALDPDIPLARQRSVFSVSGPGRGRADGLAWRVDGRLVGRGDRLEWQPEPGTHRVQLIDEHGRLRDEVGIQVRAGGR